jgi:hypothetical protein
MRRQCEGEPYGGYEPKVPMHVTGRLYLARTARNGRCAEHAQITTGSGTLPRIALRTSGQ